MTPPPGISIIRRQKKLPIVSTHHVSRRLHLSSCPSKTCAPPRPSSIHLFLSPRQNLHLRRNSSLCTFRPLPLPPESSTLRNSISSCISLADRIAYNFQPDDTGHPKPARWSFHCLFAQHKLRNVPLTKLDHGLGGLCGGTTHLPIPTDSPRKALYSNIRHYPSLKSSFLPPLRRHGPSLFRLISVALTMSLRPTFEPYQSTTHGAATGAYH